MRHPFAVLVEHETPQLVDVDSYTVDVAGLRATDLHELSDRHAGVAILVVEDRCVPSIFDLDQLVQNLNDEGLPVDTDPVEEQRRRRVGRCA